MTVLEANGITLSYDSFGDAGDETILLIAGLGTQMIRWTVPFCENLTARGYREDPLRKSRRGLFDAFYRPSHAGFRSIGCLPSLAAGKQPVVPYTLYPSGDDRLVGFARER